MAIQYKVYGTNEPYSGLTVELGGLQYSTVGGALEGFSLQLTPLAPGEQLDDADTTIGDNSMGGTNNNGGSGLIYLEQYDVGTGDGILNSVDIQYWINLGRQDIVNEIVVFINTGNMPPNQPNQGGQADMGTNQGMQQGGGMNGNGGMNGDTTPPPDITPPPPSDGGGMNQGGGNY